MAGMTPATTVVLIHGLWMTPLAWERWVERYEARGCTVLTPGYPGIGQGEGAVPLVIQVSERSTFQRITAPRSTGQENRV
jgi:alpha-beta hydrolase superfamily lysophospholipase